MTQNNDPAEHNFIEPVLIKVSRTVKKKYMDEAQEVAHYGNQEAPDEPVEDVDKELDPETIEVRRFLVEPAKVNYHYSITRNVHFQSITVGCSVTIPCYKEEIEGAIAEAKEFVARRLKYENRKTGAILDYLVDQRVKKEQDLSRRGVR